MLRTNLAVLLAERHEKITRVAADTGLSRTTLTALAQNTSKMVQFETVDTLCQYLKISPNDFFEYLPFSDGIVAEPSFEFPSSSAEDFRRGDYEWETEMFVYFIEDGKKTTCQFDCAAQAVEVRPMTSDGDETFNLDVLIKVAPSDLENFNKFYNQMSPAFKSEYRRKLENGFNAALVVESNKLKYPQCDALSVVLTFPDGVELVDSITLL